MTNKDIIIIADYASSRDMTLSEVCEACRVHVDIIHAFIQHDVIQPHGASPADWQFSMSEFERLKTAVRLQRELEVNVEALSLVLNLLDEVNDLRQQISIHHRHFMR